MIGEKKLRTNKEIYLDFSGSPASVPEVEKRVDDEEDVHAGDGDQVDQHVEHAVEFLNVEDASQEQGEEE